MTQWTNEYNPVFVCEDGSSFPVRRIGWISPIPAEYKKYPYYSKYSWQVSLHYKATGTTVITDADYQRLMQFVKYGHYEFSQYLLEACNLESGNAKVSIRADINGRFLCAEDLGSPDSRPIIANRSTASDWESFTIFLNPDQTYSFKSNANGKFVSVRVDDGGRLIAGSAKIGLWEKFYCARRILDDRGRLLLFSVANEKYVSVDPNSGIVCACADAPREWEWLYITDAKAKRV